MIETGRVHQKARTRDSLIRATRQLLAAGDTPTVEQVAAAASISRATAYRYFPNQRALLVASYPEIADSSLLGPDPPADAAARLEIVAEAIARQAVEHESELRAMLRLSLEPDTPVGKISRSVSGAASPGSPTRSRRCVDGFPIGNWTGSSSPSPRRWASMHSSG